MKDIVLSVFYSTDQCLSFILMFRDVLLHLRFFAWLFVCYCIQQMSRKCEPMQVRTFFQRLNQFLYCGRMNEFSFCMAIEDRSQMSFVMNDRRILRFHLGVRSHPGMRRWSRLASSESVRPSKNPAWLPHGYRF